MAAIAVAVAVADGSSTSGSRDGPCDATLRVDYLLSAYRRLEHASNRVMTTIHEDALRNAQPSAVARRL